ncbi:MAG: hypothetical protein K1X79_14530 [Oligoflexia bacterium]|nr:hypothetical protein [Oligoflexia bacterium]
MKAAEKIIEALTQLLEGYSELQESIENDFGGEKDDEETAEELDAALVTEMRAAVESVIENEDYTAEEIASVISALTDCLQEIDPDVFETEETEEEEDDDDYDDDDEDEDDEDLDLDEDDEDED